MRNGVRRRVERLRFVFTDKKCGKEKTVVIGDAVKGKIGVSKRNMARDVISNASPCVVNPPRSSKRHYIYVFAGGDSTLANTIESGGS